MSESGATDDPEDIASGEDNSEMEEEAEEETGDEPLIPEKRARQAITGRGLTLQMLMADGIIEAGEGLLSLEYLGQKFTADLLPSGNIKSNETGQEFASPSSWAIFCKNLVNPGKRSGCGWSSVRYKGKKLDSWKSNWFRLVKPRKPSIPSAQSPCRSAASDVGMSSDALSEGESGRPSETAASSKNSDRTTPVSQTDAPSALLQEKDAPSLKTVDSKSSITSTDSNTSMPHTKTGKSHMQTDGKGSVKHRDKCAPQVWGSTGVKEETTFEQDGVLDLTTKPKTEEKPISKSSTSSSAADVCYVGEQEEALNLSLKANPAPAKEKPAPAKAKVKQEVQSGDQSEFSQSDRNPVRYTSLPDRTHKVDQNLLVECEHFSSLNKVQPYTVSMATNSLLLMDFHCHLTTSEVVGYLGGKWDQSTQHLSIQQAFPCRCRLGDGQNAPMVEEEIRASMKHQSMSLVGWYHSHPYCLPEPSVRDTDCQMAYQLRMKGSRATYFPCVGLINSPYYGKSLRTESSLQMFMVMPPPETSASDYNLPMGLKYTVKQNRSVSEGLLHEMKKLVEFYRGSPDWISFQHSWHPGVTYLEKLKTSLNDKLPEDQMENGNFLDFVHLILAAKP